MREDKPADYEAKKDSFLLILSQTIRTFKVPDALIGLLDQAKQDETFERAKALLSNNPDFQVLGPIEENHEVADFVEPVFDIEVMSSVDTSVDDDDNNNNEVDSLSGDGLLK